MFFPRNKKAIQRPGYAEKLLGELENFRSLENLPDGENDEFPGNEKNKAIKAAYKRLWEINGDE